MSFVAKIEADVSRFSANMNKASQDTGKFVSEINKASNAAKVIVPPAVLPSINNFSKSVGNANGVTMEFTRIIQDAPFGMIGIGNNLQQLSANWQTYSESSKRAAAQTGATVTTMTLLKGALSSMISPAALLSLGVAAVTSAWTFYTMWSQKAAKATKETKSEIEKLIESLNDVSTTMFEASKSSAKESAELRILYGIATDVTASTSERRDAAKRLIDQYPELFKKFGTEKIMLGDAKTAYDSLSTSILATARAQAAYGKIGEKAAQQIAIDEANKALQKEIDLLNKAIDADKKRADQLLKSVRIGQTADEARDLAASADGLIANTVAQKKINDLQKEQSKNLLLRAGLQEGILDLEKVAIVNQKEISDGFGISKEKTAAATKALTDYVAKLNEISQKSEFSSTLAVQDEGLDSTIEKIRQKYLKLGQDTDNIEKLGLQNTKTNANTAAEIVKSAAETRKQIEISSLLEIGEATRKYQQETADTIASIHEKAGIVRSASRERELEQNKAYYNKLANDHRNNAEIINAISEARGASNILINKKWDDKALEEANKFMSKITEIENKPFSERSLTSNRRFDKELSQRLTKVQSFFDQMKEIYSKNELDLTPLIKMNDEVLAEMMAQKGVLMGQKFSESLTDTLNNGISESFISLASDLGAAIGEGGNLLQAAGKSILSSMGSLMVSLGEMAIKAGAGILAVQIGLKTLNPFVALAAGAALVAIGSAFSSGAKNLAGAGSGGGYSQSATGSQYNSIGDRNTGKLFNNDKQVVELRLKNGELTGAINLANKRNDRLV